MTGPLVVAYALTKYHQRSQTFVDLEIQELRRQGAQVWVVAVERGHEDRSGDPQVIYLDSEPDVWHRVAVAHLVWVARHPVRYAAFLRRVVALRSEAGARPEQLPWWRLPAVATTFQRAGVMVVHAHFGWSGASTAATLGALLRVPWSMTLHAKDIFSKRRNLHTKMAGAGLVITVCDYNRRWLAEHGFPAAKVEVMGCGVEVPAGSARDADVDVTLVARLIPKKGVDVLIAAVALLRERGRPVSVNVVGDGPLREALESQARELGVADSVRFLGAVNHADSLDRIASSRIFCLPCRVAPDGDRDARPTVITEAMMRGVPVVSTLEVGVPEMLDESCGRLVPSDDPTRLAAAIEEILDDPTLAARLGAAAAVRARTHYSLHDQVDRLRAMLVALATRAS